jgi:hypothetical protein
VPKSFFNSFEQYLGQEQVDRTVEIEVPGSWFGGTEMGSRTATERGAKYKAQAVEYADVREFPGPTVRARTEKAIRFLYNRRRCRRPEFRRLLAADCRRRMEMNWPQIAGGGWR